MSDEKVVVSLLVKSVKHLKDGTFQKGVKTGQAWHLWLFVDSTDKEYTTFENDISEYLGQEIKGIVTPVVGKDKDGNPTIKNSFEFDKDWKKSAKPTLKPASTLLPSGAPAYVPENKAAAFAASYSKDIVVAAITVGMVKTEDEAAIASLRFFNGYYSMITHPEGKPKTEPTPKPEPKKSFTARENADAMADAVKEGQTMFQGKVVEEDDGRETTGDDDTN